MNLDPFNLTGGSQPKTAPNPTRAYGPPNSPNLDPFNLGSVSSHVGAYTVPAAKDKSGLVDALNSLDQYHPDDQVRIINRAAGVGLVDKNKASQAVNSLVNTPTAQPKLNLLEKAVLTGKNVATGAEQNVVGAGKNVFTGFSASGRNRYAQVQSQLADQTLNKAVSDYKAGKISKDQYTQALRNYSTTNSKLSEKLQTLQAEANPKKAVNNVVNTAAMVAFPELEGSLLARTLTNSAVAGGVNAFNYATRADKPTLKGGAKAFAEGVPFGAVPTLAGGAVSKIAESRAARAAETAGVKSMPIDKLTSYEGAPDRAAVDAYKTKLQNGEPIEPLKVLSDSKGNLGIEDGKHRFQAMKEMGMKEVPVTMAAKVESKPVASLVGGEVTPYTKGVEDTLNKVKPASITTSRPQGVYAEIKNLFTPGGGAEGERIGNDLRSTMGNLALQKQTEQLGSKDAVKFFEKQPVGDNLNFIQKVQSGVKQATPELEAQAKSLRVALDKDYELAHSLKDIPYKENYFPTGAGFWQNPEKADAFVKRWNNPSLGGSPSALEQKAFPTIYDGIQAGLVPRETNPAIIALNNRAQLLRAKAAQGFLADQVAKGADPQLVQKYIDRVMGSGLGNQAWYQTAKQASYAINNLQLGFSGFHISGTGINAVVSQFSNGLQDVLHGKVGEGVKNMVTAPAAIPKYIFQGNKTIADQLAGHITPDIRNIYEGGGRIGRQLDYRTTGLAKSLEQFKSGNLGEIGKGLAAAPFRAFSTAAKPVMEWWVPRIKAGATIDLINRKLSELGPGASEEAIRAAKIEAVRSIDNRFGQLVQDNLLWNKSLKDGMSLMMRSPGWNIGTFRELGGGMADLLKPSTYKGLAAGKGLSERSAYTVSLAATTMLIGTALQYMFTGKGPQSALDYFYPKTGKTDKNGNEERVSLPTYAKDVFAFSHNPVQTVKNKANPLVSTGLQLAQNKDYFGNEIRNPQDSLTTQIKQTAGYVGKNVLPFSITNANQRVDKGVSSKTQSFFGLNPAPGYITKSPFEQQVQNALNHALGSKSMTPEEAQTAADKTKAAQATGTSQLQRQFSYLLKVDRPAAAQLINNASPKDLQKLDTPSILQDLAYTVQSNNKNTKQATKDASSKLLQVLNKSGYNTNDLYQQKKQQIKTNARNRKK